MKPHTYIESDMRVSGERTKVENIIRLKHSHTCSKVDVLSLLTCGRVEREREDTERETYHRSMRKC